jgi:hypothetical protein
MVLARSAAPTSSSSAFYLHYVFISVCLREIFLLAGACSHFDPSFHYNQAKNIFFTRCFNFLDSTDRCIIMPPD